MHTQRRYATCPQGMSKKKREKMHTFREKMHTQRRYATCPQGVSKKREKENIAHTKNITREREFI